MACNKASRPPMPMCRAQARPWPMTVSRAIAAGARRAASSQVRKASSSHGRCPSQVCHHQRCPSCPCTLSRAKQASNSASSANQTASQVAPMGAPVAGRMACRKRCCSTLAGLSGCRADQGARTLRSTTMASGGSPSRAGVWASSQRVTCCFTCCVTRSGEPVCAGTRSRWTRAAWFMVSFRGSRVA